MADDEDVLFVFLPPFWLAPAAAPRFGIDLDDGWMVGQRDHALAGTRSVRARVRCEEQLKTPPLTTHNPRRSGSKDFRALADSPPSFTARRHQHVTFFWHAISRFMMCGATFQHVFLTLKRKGRARVSTRREGTVDARVEGPPSSPSSIHGSRFLGQKNKNCLSSEESMSDLVASLSVPAIPAEPDSSHWPLPTTNFQQIRFRLTGRWTPIRKRARSSTFSERSDSNDSVGTATQTGPPVSHADEGEEACLQDLLNTAALRAEGDAGAGANSLKSNAAWFRVRALLLLLADAQAQLLASETSRCRAVEARRGRASRVRFACYDFSAVEPPRPRTGDDDGATASIAGAVEKNENEPRGKIDEQTRLLDLLSTLIVKQRELLDEVPQPERAAALWPLCAALRAEEKESQNNRAKRALAWYADAFEGLARDGALLLELRLSEFLGSLLRFHLHAIFDRPSRSALRTAEKGEGAREILANNANQGGRGAVLHFYVPRATTAEGGRGEAVPSAGGTAELPPPKRSHKKKPVPVPPPLESKDAWPQHDSGPPPLKEQADGREAEASPSVPSEPPANGHNGGGTSNGYGGNSNGHDGHQPHNSSPSEGGAGPSDPGADPAAGRQSQTVELRAELARLELLHLNLSGEWSRAFELDGEWGTVHARLLLARAHAGVLWIRLPPSPPSLPLP